MSKTIKIGGRLYSVEQGNVVAGANAILDDTKGKKQNVINSETDAELLRLDEAKQNVLTFDNAPTEDSNNPVKSGGVYAADAALQQAIEAILALIPSAATVLNQLADKAFVNSTVATNTATFRGTFNVVTDLALHYNSTHQEIATALLSVVQTADNNDYCFVQIPVSDSSGDIRVTERYKFNGTAWSYEYDLNNSGFTADQWGAINSGITSVLVGKLGGLPTAQELAIMFAGKQNTLTFDNTPVAGSDNPVKSSGLYNAFAVINAMIPEGADANNKLVVESRLVAYVTTLINALDATFDVTSADGHVTLRMTQADGVITSVQILTSDIASASALTTLAGRVSTAESDIDALQDAYAALTQSDVVIVEGALPSTGQQNIIYRQPDQDHTPPQFYSDYMWNGTTWVLMATYMNAIDPRPKKGSQNLVSSGGVFDNMGALDVSELNATENPHTLAIYADLSAALADIPLDYQKGGMSIKFVQSSDNKYVQYRLLAQTFSTTPSDWQEFDNEKLGKQLNLLGLPYYTINASIDTGTGALTPRNTDNYKTLLCPVDEVKKYRYYSGVSGGVNAGAMYAFLDNSLSTISYAPINSVGWVNIGNVPTGAKYFAACIKFASALSESGAKKCCFIEENKWFEYLESLANAVETAMSDNWNIVSNQDGQIEKISRGLFESGFAFISKLGVVDKYYLGYIGDNGDYSYNNNGKYKTIVSKVIPGKKYKLYVSRNNSANSYVGNYSFFSSNVFTTANLISTQHNPAKNTWLELTAPVGAEYFACCLVFNNTGDLSDCCFVEKNKWVEFIENGLQQTSQNAEDIQDLLKIKSAFDYESKNKYDGSFVLGWLSPANGSLNDTSSQGDKYVTTDYIPVKPNTYYSLSNRLGLNIDVSVASGYSSDKATAKVLLKKDGTTPTGDTPYYIWSGSSIVQNGIFKTDANTYWVRFTIRYNNSPSSDWTHIMLEEIGDYYDDQWEPSVYEPYAETLKVKESSLPLSVSILNGKKIAYNGDSFCESRLTGGASNGGSYPVLISEATGCIFENRAISGGILSTGTSSYNPDRKICLDVENMAQDADLICFEGGINDWSSNVPLGTFDVTDYTSSYDESTITGALESIFRQAINRWVGKPICFIICHKISISNSHFTAGTFWDVHDRMVEVCNKWSIPYYDAFLHSGLNGMISAQNNAFLNGGATHPDGWHPDRGGYVKYYVPQLIKLFESLLQVNEDF